MDQPDRQSLLTRCKGIRVTDWHDAMDAIGLFDRGLMSSDIGPLWRDTEGLTHCIVGIAYTVRYVPATETIIAASPEEFLRQKGEWYGSQLKWAAELQPGDSIVFDGTNTRDTGFIGSMNSLTWLAKRVVGCVANTGARDTDELIKQRVPVYCTGVSRGTQPNRVRVDGYQIPIECGGVYVHPGDLVVADGDGVMVIPQDRVEEALAIAREIQRGDQHSRACLYDELGIPRDLTLGDATGEAVDR